MSHELTVFLEPAPREYGLHREQYMALIEDSEELGAHVRLERPAEQRGTPNAAEYYDLVIRVRQGSTALLATVKLIGIVRERLKSDQRGRASVYRRAKIYLPAGSEHEFDLTGD
jgi:hypothetical protein